MTRTYVILLAVSAVFLLKLGCAAEPAKGPGLCKLRCSDAIIATRDYEIVPLTPELSLKCLNTDPNVSSYRDVRAKFLVTRTRNIGTGDETVAVPNVSIQPVLRGLIDRRPEVISGGVQGMKTKESNFCSDQCGVITLDYSVECIPQGDGEAQAYVMSGSLVSTGMAKVTIEAPSFEDDDDDTNTDTEEENTQTLTPQGNGGL